MPPPAEPGVTVRRRFLHPIWLVLSLPCYVGWRLLPALALGPWVVAAGIALLSAACVIIPAAVRTRSSLDRRFADRLAWVGLTAMGFLSTLFVVTVLRDVLLLGAWGMLPGPRAQAFAIASARWAVASTAAFTVIGLIMARRPRMVDVAIPIAGLAPALQGFSIAQISDLHVGPTIKRRFVERIVARVNGLNADVIAVTGDVVDGSVRDLAPHTAPLAGLAAPLGVYFVTGNHEYYSGEPAWTAEFRRLGMTVLKNEHVLLQHRGVPLLLAGVTDYAAQRFEPAQASDPLRALDGAPAGIKPRILLAHQPGTAAAAAAAGYDVQLSGHTHGGQFWPWNHFIRFFQPFTAGLNREGSLWVYVSRGTGYWGPPNRFLVPSEITRIRLIADRA